MEQVEADVALLMAGYVLAFKDFATTTATIAYLGFQEELPRLPSNGLFRAYTCKECLDNLSY